ncbi:thiamine phosphate synthase [Chryseobacterium daecheongense]|uniref:Thiamine phosphate synthase n=1 Tax=Chryseobacterium daecheongense TaxID=192389 RepID=A0A3N0VTY0_9FLAO|nr:thiamine phosphate synthase [Chryseobacterium daecheongense]ROH96273.1 thiamine phosphate synthase [Chryseobacterium daecheongense]TDX89904.1 thiamine-phosphate pyrophosphorylase [Chryseobacterium daecheongense]
MIIVITPESIISNETEIINQLFQEGLDLLHVRKPFISNEKMKNFLDRIDSPYHAQVVLHSHYDLGEEYAISRFHIREKERKNGWAVQFKNQTLSTSVHDINAYNRLEKEWEYSFISPVFPSISKRGYGENTTVLEDIKHRDNPNVKLVALGGIDENNIHEAFDSGVDGVAVLGAIWESNQPLQVFRRCIQNALS